MRCALVLLCCRGSECTPWLCSKTLLRAGTIEAHRVEWTRPACPLRCAAQGLPAKSAKGALSQATDFPIDAFVLRKYMGLCETYGIAGGWRAWVLDFVPARGVGWRWEIGSLLRNAAASTHACLPSMHAQPLLAPSPAHMHAHLPTAPPCLEQAASMCRSRMPAPPL